MENLKSIIKPVLIILIVGVLIYLVLRYEQNTSNNYVSMTRTERLEADIENYKEELNRYKEEIDDLNSKVEDLEEKNSYLEEYNDLLKEQLENNGIEPEEL